jgi:hypothetical protein
VNIEQAPWRTRLEKATASRLPGSPVHHGLLLALLVLAALLRLWDLPHIPFTHDEISALLRVRFHSFGDLVAQGVAIDAHPAGVQVFEWVWTGLFGTSEAAVKLPFILLSVAALFLLYRFAAAWTSPAAALLSIAFIGTIQYTVMYGQIARPYAAGFFTCALLVDQLTRAIGTGRLRAWAAAALAAALCAYVHHFALLFALLAWLCFLPLAWPRQRKPLLWAGAAALLLYAPHIPITIRQYGYKGVGQWLPPPDNDWIPGYAAWIFEYSLPLAIVVLGTGLAGWLRLFRSKGAETASPFIPLCFALGLVPLAVGYAYSLWRAPVLQYSVVIFSFPFLVFPLFAGWRALKTPALTLLVGLIAGTSVFELIVVRKHYETFYRSKYEAAVRGIVETAAHPGRLALVDLPAEIPGFYFRQWGVDSAKSPYLNLRHCSTTFVDSMANASRAQSVFFAEATGTVPAKLTRLRSAFPFLAARHDFVEGQTFLFTARPNGNRLNDRPSRSTIAPEAVLGEGWQADVQLPLVQDTTAHFGGAPKQWNMAGHEFGLVFERSVYDLGAGGNDVLEAAMDVANAAPDSQLKLVMELLEGDRRMAYSSSDVQAGPGRSVLVVAIPLSDLPQHGQGARLKVYAWNPARQQAGISSITVDVQQGNPWLYGFFQPLLAPLAFP